MFFAGTIRAAARDAAPWPSGRGGYDHDSHNLHCLGQRTLACMYIVVGGCSAAQQPFVLLLLLLILLLFIPGKRQLRQFKRLGIASKLKSG